MTGKSGRFAEHVIIHFERDVLEQLIFGDRIVVRAHGIGLEVAGYPGVHLKSMSPAVFDALRIEDDEGKLAVPVSAIVPPELLGAGSGLTSESGAICIQTTDRGAIERAGLDTLRLGDLVALEDYDSAWGHGYRKGSVGIGVVSSTDSIRAGYGPGVTLLMTSPAGDIAPIVVEGTNLGALLSL